MIRNQGFYKFCVCLHSLLSFSVAAELSDKFPCRWQSLFVFRDWNCSLLWHGQQMKSIYSLTFNLAPYITAYLLFYRISSCFSAFLLYEKGKEWSGRRTTYLFLSLLSDFTCLYIFFWAFILLLTEFKSALHL